MLRIKIYFIYIYINICIYISEEKFANDTMFLFLLVYISFVLRVFGKFNIYLKDLKSETITCFYSIKALIYYK